MTHTLDVRMTSTTNSESVDDIPLLVAHLQRMGVQRLIDAHVPAMPGSTSFGWVAVLWLAHMLSQSGRFPRHLRAWVAAHPELLHWLTNQSIRPADVQDTRLRDLLHALDDDDRWLVFETALNSNIAKTYRTRPERIRLTRTTGLWYVTAEGSLQFDQSRRWWPGGMQMQVTLATHEPLGLPISVWVAGPDEERLPALGAVTQTRSTLPGRRVVYIGNGELSPIEVRAAIQAGSDSYVCVLSREEALQELRRARAGNWPSAVASDQGQLIEGYESHEPLQSEWAGQAIEWVERRLLVRSHYHAHEQEHELMTRLGRAQRELAALNERKRGKRRPRTMVAMREAAETILVNHGVNEIIRLSFDEQVDERTVRRYRGRPTTTRVDRLVSVIATVDETALNAARDRLGWQVYATTMSAADLPIDQAERMCGDPDHSFERLRGRALSLMPGVIQRADHVRGLVRLLTIGLRAMALLDSTMRLRSNEFTGLIWQRTGGNCQSMLPTGERLLDAFRDITLTTIVDGLEHRYHMTALSSLQRRVIDALALPSDTYQIRSSE
jgi:transposase